MDTALAPDQRIYPRQFVLSIWPLSLRPPTPSNFTFMGLHSTSTDTLPHFNRFAKWLVLTNTQGILLCLKRFRYLGTFSFNGEEGFVARVRTQSIGACSMKVGNKICSSQQDLLQPNRNRSTSESSITYATCTQSSHQPFAFHSAKLRVATGRAFCLGWGTADAFTQANAYGATGTVAVEEKCGKFPVKTE